MGRRPEVKGKSDAVNPFVPSESDEPPPLNWTARPAYAL
jgi:hypothetical protein